MKIVVGVEIVLDFYQFYIMVEFVFYWKVQLICQKICDVVFVNVFEFYK